MTSKVLIAALIATLAALPAAADVLLLNNGDRLSGVIVGARGGKLTMKTELAGEVHVPLANVQSLSTDKPLRVLLSDGSEADGLAAASQTPGQFLLKAEAGGAAAQSVALAEVKALNPPPVCWKGSLSVGAVATSGNSEGESINVAFNAQRDAGKNRTTVAAGYHFSRSEDPDTGEDNTSRDEWFASVKQDRFFSESFYGYARARVDRDRMADLEHRLSPGVGVGYQWLRGDATNLLTEGGLSSVHEKYADPSRTEDYMAARLAYDFDRTLHERVKFFHSLEYLPSLEEASTYLINTDAGVRVKINAHLFTEFKAELNYNAQPSDDNERLDVKYLANVGLTF